jgi:predicted component of type VI protein secretion system
MWILITILTFKILQQRVEKIINTINIKKATGADNIPAKVVRQCKVTVAQQLPSLINLSINTVFFQTLKVARQTPSRDPSILQLHIGFHQGFHASLPEV